MRLERNVCCRFKYGSFTKLGIKLTKKKEQAIEMSKIGNEIVQIFVDDFTEKTRKLK